MKHLFLKYRGDCLVMAAIFFVSLAVRIHYQNNSIIDGPIRADGLKYFQVAYNLHYFKVYSPDIPTSPNTPPKENFSTPAPPGYPLFLYPFVATSASIGEFLHRVARAQAILGSLTAVLTYLLARLCFFAIPWAALPGMLAAANPHLIALDHYLMSESLYVLMMVVSVLMLVLAWRKDKPIITFITGLFFGLSILIRPISLFLCPVMGIVFFFNPLMRASAPVRRALVHFACLIIGCALVYSPYVIFRNAERHPASMNVSVSGHSLWKLFVQGTDINLTDWKKDRLEDDPFIKIEREKMFSDKSYAIPILYQQFKDDPVPYIKWYMWGKLIFMWQWDNMFNGDVYQYPMVRKGFQADPALHALHSAMRFVHWPLFALMLAGLLIFPMMHFTRNPAPEWMALLPHLLVLIYFSLLLILLHPLPRYAIPLRPFSFIMATAALTWAVSLFKKKEPS